jgi:hypothetical protein
MLHVTQWFKDGKIGYKQKEERVEEKKTYWNLEYN